MTPKQAYEKALEAGHSIPELEAIIAEDAHWAYCYAHDILQAPFPAGEEAISKDARCAYCYAHDILQAPFPRGEEAISKDAHPSYLYARYVLQAPFPLGEETISKHETFARKYVLHFGHLLSQESLEKFRGTLKKLARNL